MIEIIPPEGLRVAELDFDEPAQVNRSAWTGTRKVIGQPGGGLWTGQVYVDNIATEYDERKWRGFLTGLRGVQNWFKAYLPCQTHIGPQPTVGVGAGNGYTLPLAGMAVSTCILEAGQHITVTLPSGHARAIRLSAPLITDELGKAMAQFGPALNEIPAFGTTVETARPYVPVAADETRIAMPIADGISGFTMAVSEVR